MRILRVTVTLLIFIVLLYSACWCYFYNKVPNGNDFFSGIVGSIVATSLTTVLILIAYWQLSKLFNTSNADFIHKLKNDFFKEETRRLFHLIEHDYIFFRESMGDYDKCKQIENICEQHKSGEAKEYFFEVNTEKIKHSGLPSKIQEDLLSKPVYSSFELDDLMLGHFEDVGLFEERGIIDIKMVYEEFSWYLKATFDNCQIQKYLDALGSDFYDKYKYIQKKCESYEKVKAAKKVVWIWKFKYLFFKSGAM